MLKISKIFYTIDDETDCIFNSNEKFHFSSMAINQQMSLTPRRLAFYPIAKTLGFENWRYYIKKIIIKNRGSSEKAIGVTPDNDHPKSEFFKIRKYLHKISATTPN